MFAVGPVWHNGAAGIPSTASASSGPLFSPPAGAEPLGRLAPLDIQAWLAQLLAGGMAQSSVHRKYRVLRRLLQVAVDNGVLAKSPCASVQPPRVETNEMRFLSPEEIVALVEEIDPWFRPFVYTAVETGMRWSELVGLRRSGVDVLRRRIAVTEQLVFIGGDVGRTRRPLGTPAAQDQGGHTFDQHLQLPGRPAE